MGRPSGCGDTSHYCTCTLPGLPVKWTAMYTLSRISKVLLSSSFAVTYTAAPWYLQAPQVSKVFVRQAEKSSLHPIKRLNIGDTP